MYAAELTKSSVRFISEIDVKMCDNNEKRKKCHHQCRKAIAGCRLSMLIYYIEINRTKTKHVESGRKNKWNTNYNHRICLLRLICSRDLSNSRDSIESRI